MTDLPAAVARIKWLTLKEEPWSGDDFSQAQPSYDPSETDSAIATILNAVASGDLVLKADVDGLVEIGKAIAAHDARPEYNGRYMELRALIDRMRAALTALENRNDR